MDGLAKEFHLVTVAARRDPLQRWNAGMVRTRNRGESGLFQHWARSHDSAVGFLSILVIFSSHRTDKEFLARQQVKNR